MTNGVARLPSTVHVSPVSEIVSPLSTRALFWRARHLRQSGLLRHLPFIFWLIETCRPTLHVELGVNEGVAYFAACQALDKLDPEARCVGIGPWQNTGGKVPEAIRWLNNELYADFSQLIEDDPRKAAGRFRDGSVDLLLIDLDMDAELVDGLLHDWPTKLSKRSVILLHGTEGPRFAEGPGRSLLNKLLERCPTVRFETGDGLVAVLWGEARDEKLLKLAELAPGDPGHAEVHNAFSRLGAAHHLEWSSRNEAERARDLARQLGALRAEKEAMGKELAAQVAAYDERNRQVAGFQSRLFDVQTMAEVQADELARLRERLASQEAAAATLQARLEEREAKVAALTARFEERSAALAATEESLSKKIAELESVIAARQVEVAVLQDQLDARFRETASLTRELEKAEDESVALRARIEEREAKVAALTTQIEERDAAAAKAERSHREREASLGKEIGRREERIAELNGTLEELCRQAELLRQHHEAILGSTSWRMTGPVRRALDRLRSRKG